MVDNLSWGLRVIDGKKKEEVVIEEKVEVTPPVEGEGEKKEPEPPKREMAFFDVFGEIRRDLTKQLTGLLRPGVETDKMKRLYISFSSGGGGLVAAYYIDDLLSTYGAPSVAICGSMNASAATLLICKRNLRLAFPNARFMLHDAFSINDGTVAQQREVLRNYEEVRGNFVQDYMDYIGLTKKEAERIMVKDTYFNAHDALNMGTKGLIDGIILKQLGDFKVEIAMRGGVIKTVDLHDDDFIAVKDTTVETATQPVKAAE